jgi:hypothetical protein
LARYGETPISTVTALKFVLVNESSPNVQQLRIIVNDLDYRPEDCKFDKIFRRINDPTSPVLTVVIDDLVNQVRIEASDLSFIFLNQVLDGAIGFITELIPKSEPIEMSSEAAAIHPPKPATSVKVCVNDAIIMIPKSTTDNDMITVHF